MQFIRLPNGYTISLTSYVWAWKRLLTLPVDHQLKGWHHEPTPAGVILDEIRHAIHDRINTRANLLEGDTRFQDRRHRRKTIDWQRDCLQLAHRLNTPRLIVREQEARRILGRRLAARLSHRLTTPNDL